MIRPSDSIATHDLIDGRYQVLSKLGSGASGTVYLARDNELEREVAVKVLSGLFAGEWAETRRQRFLREGKALALLNHKGIVSVKRIGLMPDGRPYLVMEYIHGQTLSEFIANQKTLTCSQAVAISADVAEALSHAHGQGVLHRDIKPQNILLVQEDGKLSPRVLDFGLSSLTQGDNKLTNTGTLIGTPAYMCPDRGRGDDPNVRWDIYSLGCILFEMLTGRPPFSYSDPFTTMWHHAHTPIPKLTQIDRRARLPALLDSIIERATAKYPDERYSTMSEMLDNLRSPELFSSNARIDPQLVLEKIEQSLSRKSNGILVPAVCTVVALSLLCAAISFMLAYSPAIAARSLAFVSTVSPGSAVAVNRLLSWEARMGGPQVIDALAQSTLSAPEINTLPAKNKLAMSMGFLNNLSPDIVSERDWSVIFAGLRNAFACLREEKDLQTPETIRALDVLSGVLMNDSISDKHCTELAQELQANEMVMKSLIKTNYSLYLRLYELLATTSIRAADHRSSIEQNSWVLHWALQAAQYHVNDSDDETFDRLMQLAQRFCQAHPALMQKEIRMHQIQASRYVVKHDQGRAQAELAQASEIEKHLNTIQHFHQVMRWELKP